MFKSYPSYHQNSHNHIPLQELEILPRKIGQKWVKRVVGGPLIYETIITVIIYNKQKIISIIRKNNRKQLNSIVLPYFVKMNSNDYFQAIQHGDIKVVIKFKQQCKNSLRSEFPQDNGLIMAVKAQQHQIVKLLSPQQSSYLNKQGWSALHVATFLGDLDMVNILLPFEFKIQTSLSCSIFPKGSTALDIALLKGNDNITKQIIKFFYQNDFVSEAAFYCSSAEEIISQYFNEKDSHSRVLSHYLAFVKDETIVNRYLGKVLYQQQCQDKFGFTPLHYAALCKNIYYIQEVVTSNAQHVAVFSKQQSNYMYSDCSALMIAVFNNNIESVRLLLNSQAGFQNNSGFTALMLAAKLNHFDIAALLIDKESGLVTRHCIDNIYQGSSAIFFAEKHKNYKIVNLLIPFEKLITNLKNQQFNETQKLSNLSSSQQIQQIVKQRSVSQQYKCQNLNVSNIEQLQEEQGFGSSLYKSLQKEQEEKLELQISGQLVSHKFGRSLSQRFKYNDNNNNNFKAENIDASILKTQDSSLFNLNRKESVQTSPGFEQHSVISLAKSNQIIKHDVSIQTEQLYQFRNVEKDCSLDIPYQKLMNILVQLDRVKESCQKLQTASKIQKETDLKQHPFAEMLSNLSNTLKLSLNNEQYEQCCQNCQQKYINTSNQLLLSSTEDKKLVQSQSFHQFQELSYKFDEETKHLYQKYSVYVKQLAQENCQLKMQQQNYVDQFNICFDSLKQFSDQLQNQTTFNISRLNQQIVKIFNFLFKIESKQQTALETESPTIKVRQIKAQQSPLVHGQFDAGSMEMSGL